MDNSRVYCVTYNIKDQFGGMTASLLKRAKILGDKKGIPVDIVTFAMNYDIRQNIHLVKDKIGETTKILNLYDYLSGEEFPIDTVKKYDIGEEGCTSIQESEKRIYRIFKNGKYIMRKDFESYDGILSSISYIDDALNIYKKEEYDKRGYLRRTIFYNTSNKKMRQVLFYRKDRSCYLAKHLDYKNDEYKIKNIYHFDRNGEVINNFKSEDEVKNYFLDGITSRFQENFFVIDSEAIVPYIIKYKNNNENNVYKIYVNHNAHMEEPFNYDSPLRTPIESIYKDVSKRDAIIVLTEEQKKDIDLRFGNLDNCFVIPHSYSGKIVKSDFAKRNLKKVISIARFDPQKQNEDMIKAFNLVVKEVPDAILEFYGFGESETSMRDLINELNLQNNVFIKGFANNVEDIFRTSAIKIMSSKYEGQPLVILESLSYGCPIISYKTKYGPSDMIKDGENGRIVEYNNYEELAKATVELLKNPKKIEEMSNNCYESLKNFTDDLFVERWFKLFDELVYRRKKKKILNGIQGKVTESKWSDIDNLDFSIESNIVFEEKLLNRINRENIKYRFKNRKTQEIIDMDIDRDIKIINEEVILCKQFNLNTICKDKNFTNGFWDLYLAVEVDGEVLEKRLGRKKEECLEEIESITNGTEKQIIPYYTKHNNFSFKII